MALGYVILDIIIIGLVIVIFLQTRVIDDLQIRIVKYGIYYRAATRQMTPKQLHAMLKEVKLARQFKSIVKDF